MKSLKSIPIALLVLSFVLHHPNEKLDLLSLDEALSKGLVKLESKSLGTYSKECIELKVVNLTAADLNISLNAGSVFIPEDPGMQNIFVVQDQLILAKKSIPTTQKIKGFCCESSDACPSEKTKFSLGKMEDKKLLALAKHINENNYPEEVFQDAVWCVSDQHSNSDIYFPEDEAKVKTLREEVCKLTGQKENWYRNKTHVEVSESGRINRETVLIEGDLELNVEKPLTLKKEIYTEDGVLFLTMPGETSISRLGKVSYHFQLKVKGWKKGNYYVSVKSADTEVLRQAFTI